MIFDTFRDQQNGFVFGTNAAGVQYDAQVRNQGEPATSWDGSWEVKTQHHRRRVDGRVPHPAAHAALRSGAADLGRQLLPQHPAHARARLLVAAAARSSTSARLSSAGELRGLELRDAAQLQAPAVRRQLGQPQLHAGRRRPTSTATSASTRSSASRRSLNLDADLQHRLRAGRGRHAADQPDALQPALPGEAAVLPRELGAVHAIGKGERARSVLQPAHRPRRGRRAGADPGRRASERQDRRLQRRRAEHADRRRSASGPATTSPCCASAASCRAVRASARCSSTAPRPATWPAPTTGTARGALDAPARRRRAVHGRRALPRAPRRRASSAATTPTTSTRSTTTARHRVEFEYGRHRRGLQPRGRLPRERRSATGAATSRFQETMRQERIRSWGFREFLPHVNYTRYDYLDGGLHNAELHVDNHWDWENGNFIDTALNGTWEGLPRAVRGLSGHHRAGRASTAASASRLRSNTDRRKWIFGRLQWDVGTLPDRRRRTAHASR